MSHTSIHLLIAFLTSIKKDCGPRQLSQFGATAALFRVYSHSMNLSLLTLLSMLGMLNFQEKNKNKIFVCQALNPQISPAPHLFGYPLPQGRRSTGLFPYDSLIGAAHAGTFWTEGQFKLSKDIPLEEENGRRKVCDVHLLEKDIYTV